MAGIVFEDDDDDVVTPPAKKAAAKATKAPAKKAAKKVAEPEQVVSEPPAWVDETPDVRESPRGRLVPTETADDPAPDTETEPEDWDRETVEGDAVTIKLGHTLNLFGRDHWINTEFHMVAQPGDWYSDLAMRAKAAALETNFVMTNDFIAIKTEHREELRRQQQASNE